MAVNDGAVLQRIEFVPLSDTRVLVVVVSNNGQVTQKAVDLDELLSSDDLAHAAQLPEHRVRRPARSARCARRCWCGCSRSARSTTSCWRRALRLAQASLDDVARPAVVPRGRRRVAHRATTPTACQLATLRALLEMMEEKERMVRLLTHYIDGPGLTIIIGAEHTAPGLRPFSLIAATAVDGGATRTVGVIGPTRMDYSRAIALVDGTTQAVTRVLRDAN